jgi:hypothetical protein
LMAFWDRGPVEQFGRTNRITGTQAADQILLRLQTDA